MEGECYNYIERNALSTSVMSSKIKLKKKYINIKEKNLMHCQNYPVSNRAYHGKLKTALGLEPMMDGEH